MSSILEVKTFTNLTKISKLLMTFHSMSTKEIFTDFWGLMALERVLPKNDTRVN
ncbi:MAG: hypothetical protein CM15mP65_05690 [Crocinitomicaceae bacterium]|nr:MAG: hypothetical protein CM15mP65_05690 [Crocinitomicaceae bacterium]